MRGMGSESVSGQTSTLHPTAVSRSPITDIRTRVQQRLGPYSNYFMVTNCAGSNWINGASCYRYVSILAVALEFQITCLCLQGWPRTELNTSGKGTATFIPRFIGTIHRYFYSAIHRFIPRYPPAARVQTIHRQLVSITSSVDYRRKTTDENDFVRRSGHPLLCQTA